MRALRYTEIIEFNCEDGFDIQHHSTEHCLLGIGRRRGLRRMKFAPDRTSAIFKNQQISNCSGLVEIKLFEPCGIDVQYRPLR
jgi:hypothetical protein